MQLEKSNVSTELLYEFKIEDQEEIPTRQDDFSPDIFIKADKNRVTQVLDNLLTNAIKSTKDGIVSISITKHKKGENNTDTIIASVRDIGPGIHPEILPSLFSKFGSRSDMGTGLGLFISKNIVVAHRGKIWGKNNSDGKGATLMVLSLEDPDPEATDLNSYPYCGYINRNNWGQSTLKSRLRLVACVTLFTCTSLLLVINFDNVGWASLPMVIASLPFRRNEIVIS